MISIKRHKRFLWCQGGKIMFVKLLEFIHQVLSGLTTHPGVHWGKMEMMKPYSGWYGYIQNMFSNLGWGTIFFDCGKRIALDGCLFSNNLSSS